MGEHLRLGHPFPEGAVNHLQSDLNTKTFFISFAHLSHSENKMIYSSLCLQFSYPRNLLCLLYSPLTPPLYSHFQVRGHSSRFISFSRSRHGWPCFLERARFESVFARTWTGARYYLSTVGFGMLLIHILTPREWVFWPESH